MSLSTPSANRIDVHHHYLPPAYFDGLQSSYLIHHSTLH